MQHETPILMITLQIPVNDDTTAEGVLSEIGQRLTEAIAEIREQQREPSASSSDSNLTTSSGPIVDEQAEGFSEQTQYNLLKALGYARK